MMKKGLQAGTQNFAKLISDGSYYVDKTMIIKELLESQNAVNLITRPRRFGKSLMIDMLYNFFSQTADPSIFDGLAIRNEKDICEKYMGKFPVLLLDLSGFSSVSYRDALNVFAGKIADLALSLRPLYNSGKMDPQDKALMETYFALRDVNTYPKNTEDFAALLRPAPYNLCSILHEYYGKNVVVLIDEYDVPLNQAYIGGFYDSMVGFIKLMFEKLLKITKILEFSVITGCLRISKESIFTGMNNISVWGRDDNFIYEYFGFTENEVVDLLTYYSLTDVLDSAREWYDGYLFGSEHVYCPWDIIKFVGKCRRGFSKTPSNYWTDSSGNDILILMLQESDAAMQKDYLHLLAGQTIQKAITDALTYRDLSEPGENIWSLLVATGYLTIQGYAENADTDGVKGTDVENEDEDKDEGENEDEDEDEDENKTFSRGKLCELKIPNGEIKELFGLLLHNWLHNSFHTDPQTLAEFCAAFPKGDPGTVEQRLKKILYDAMSSRDMSAQDQQKEYFYHGTVLGLLYSKWKVRSNIQSGDGYCDLGFFSRKNLAIVIEMKFDSNDLEASAKEALRQIEIKRYTDEFFRDGATKILCYGIACYRDNCRVLLDIKTIA